MNDNIKYIYFIHTRYFLYTWFINEILISKFIGFLSTNFTFLFENVFILFIVYLKQIMYIIDKIIMKWTQNLDYTFTE